MNRQGNPATSTTDSERLKFLSDAGLALVSSLDYAVTLQKVADLSLGLLCDYCIFDLLDDDHRSKRVAWAHSNQRFARVGEIGKFAPPIRPPHPVADLVATGQPILVPDIDDDWMRRTTWSPEHYNLMRELNAHSAMYVPLTAHGAIIGWGIFAFSDTPRCHASSDLSLAVELGRRVGLAVLHARQFDALQAGSDRLRQMTEHQSALIGELNHRVKNTLAIVQAMATQSLRWGSTNPDAALAAFRDRLRALAAAHDVLTRNRWEDTDLVDLANRTLEVHQGASEERFDVVGDPVQLSPKLALEFAMTFHELATNAVKYGALSNEQGRVRISWRILTNNGRRLSFHWQETNGPPVVAPTRRGFGTRLIEGQFAGGDGSVYMDYAPAGLICSIEVQLAYEEQDVGAPADPSTAPVRTHGPVAAL